MSAGPFTDRLDRAGTKLAVIEPAQQAAAKVVGFIYLFAMAVSILAFQARSHLIVGGDAVQTARNIAGSERLFRISTAGDLIMVAGDILLVWALYVVLKPVNRNLALLAAFWRLVECSVIAATTLNAFAALALLSGADYLRAIETGQLQALVYVFLRVHGAGFRIAFVFLGLGSALFSGLWFASRYVPRALAVLGIFASLLLALVSLATLVFPGLGSVEMVFMVPMFFYEVGLGLWLLIRGLKAPPGGTT